MGLIKLFLDRQNRRIVAINGGASPIPTLFQGDTQQFEITIVDPTGSVTLTAGYNYPDLSGSGLRVSLGGAPVGTAGQTPLALSTSWTWTNKGSYYAFVGSIALNTQGITDYLGALSERQIYFEIKDTVSANRGTIYQAQVLLKAVIDEESAVAPTPSASYPTWDQASATFVPFQMPAGTSLTIVSPDGSKGVTLSVNNAGDLLETPVLLS